MTDSITHEKKTKDCRLTLPTPEEMTTQQRTIHDQIVSGPRKRLVGPLRAALHNPTLADKWQQLGQVLRFEISLPPHLKELAILVTARRWSSQLEWGIHAGDAVKAGLKDDIIEAVRHCRAPDFKDDKAAAEIYEYARLLVQTGDVTQDAHHAIVARWDEVGVVELTALVGYYSMVAMTLNAHRIPLPEGVQADLAGQAGDLAVLPPAIP